MSAFVFPGPRSASFLHVQRRVQELHGYALTHKTYLTWCSWLALPDRHFWRAQFVETINDQKTLWVVKVHGEDKARSDDFFVPVVRSKANRAIVDCLPAEHLVAHHPSVIERLAFLTHTARRHFEATRLAATRDCGLNYFRHIEWVDLCRQIKRGEARLVRHDGQQLIYDVRLVRDGAVYPGAFLVVWDPKEGFITAAVPESAAAA